MAQAEMAPDLTDKTCLITGANSGIGKFAAVKLAQMGARVFVLCRSKTRGEQTVKEIRETTGNQDVEVIVADLASQQQIRRAAQEFLDGGHDLHILLNNAGLMAFDGENTQDGIEMNFGVNHLGHFLLTNLLLDRIKASAPARIVNVASNAHKMGGGRMEFEDLEGVTPVDGMRAYGQSKLANILFTRELSAQLEGTGVTVNALCPGVVKTDIDRASKGFFPVLWKCFKPLFRSIEKGAATSIYLCSSPEVDGVSGRFFSDCKEQQPSDGALDEGDAQRLWTLSEKLTGLTGGAH